MRPPRFGALPALLLVLTVTACATGPDGRVTGSFWDFSWLNGSSKPATREAPAVTETPPAPAAPIVEVDDPSVDEDRFNQAEKPSAQKPSGIADIPIIGPLLAALFPADSKLPDDDEIAVEDKSGQPGSTVVVEEPEGPENLARLDVEPPRVKVHYATHGRLKVFGPTMTIRGSVSDPSGVAELRVNGEPVPLKDRSFAYKMAAPVGYEQVEIAAVDHQGNVSKQMLDVVRQADRATRRRIDRNVEAATLVRRYGGTKRTVTNSTANPRTAMRDPGVYMVLLAGTPGMHIVKMPNLKQCREAVEYTSRAACTVKTRNAGLRTIR